jgi:Carboxypeptidase regulatory-like domain
MPGYTHGSVRDTALFSNLVRLFATALLIVVLLLSANASEQRSAGAASQQQLGAIQGTVSVRNGYGQPTYLAGVRVELDLPYAGAEALAAGTDSDGHYEFVRLRAGSYTLRVNPQGFAPFVKTIKLSAGESTVVDVVLRIQAVVQQVTVNAQGERLSPEAAAPASTVKNQELEALPLAEQKFKSALPLVPGVIRTPDGKLDIRGSSEDQGMLEVDSTQTVDPVTGSFSIPVPIDAIRAVKVDKTPYSAQYGGFSGGLATIETVPPPTEWNYKLADFNVSFRGKNDHVVGISRATPRVYFGGPLIANRLNFSEAFDYDVTRDPVRGLPWPQNEIKKQGFDSFSSFQAILSPQHLLTVDIDAFPERTQFANIAALLPQAASSDYDRKGVSVNASDLYNFASAALLSIAVRYTRFDSNAHGQGPDSLLITPEGWGGNFFNDWDRTANQFEAVPTFQFASQQWHGHHQIELGADVTYRSFSGVSQSHPVRLLRQDGTVAEEIDFQGTGTLDASAAEVDEFIQDHWLAGDHLALDFGGRLSSESIGRAVAFAPRAALAYSPGKNQKTVIRAGAGLFYDRVPLLAADFADNPERVVSLFGAGGAIIGTPEIFQNAYVANGSGSIASRVRLEPNTSPRSIVADAEVDRQLWGPTTLRLSYTFSQTQKLFVVNPLPAGIGSSAILALSGSGNSHYHEFEATVHFQPIERSEMNVSYIWSRTRGDLNTLSDVYIPFEQPVIRPNVSGFTASDVPNRLVGWGIFRLPWGLVLAPVVDLHTGFRYSSVDVLQNYVGEPDGRRYPTFFSLDCKIYRDFNLPLPLVGRGKSHKMRIGLYSINITNHGNYNAVYNNIASPFFGQFAGFNRRVDGFLLSVVQ